MADQLGKNGSMFHIQHAIVQQLRDTRRDHQCTNFWRVTNVVEEQLGFGNINDYIMNYVHMTKFTGNKVKSKQGCHSNKSKGTRVHLNTEKGTYGPKGKW